MKLDKTSFRWALNNIQEHSDTDIFPKLFEIDAIQHNWSAIIQKLLRTDIENHDWVGGRRIIIPKGKYSFRSATQLDPIDNLILTAIVYEYGIVIEESRIPIGENKVFSHRFMPTSDFELYNNNINWNLFWKKSLEKANELEDGYVLMADITDYYNQIYHHTLENELELIKMPTEVIKSVTNLFKKLTHTVSRGIPVGPHATHLLAELCFNPIDNDLISNGFDFCRYVDDMHFFCESKEQAEITLWDLARILDEQQQLVLQRTKIKIIPADKFIEIAKEKVNDKPLNSAEKDIIDIIKRHSSGEPYKSVDYDELTENEKQKVIQSKIESVFSEYLQNDNVPRIKWFIRRLSQIGAPGGVPFLIDNMMNLISAFGDISKYFVASEETLVEIDADWNEIGKKLIQLLNQPLVNHSEFLKLTIINLFGKIGNLNNNPDLTKNYNNQSSSFVKRKIIKASVKADNYHWLHGIRREFDVSDPWLRRAILLGASTFPEAQKNHWLNHIKKRKDLSLLEESVILWIENGGQI